MSNNKDKAERITNNNSNNNGKRKVRATPGAGGQDSSVQPRSIIIKRFCCYCYKKVEHEL